MLENLIGKNVFVLISTRSGVSVSTSSSGGVTESAINGVCKITGTFKDFDDKFVLITNATNHYMNIYDKASMKNSVNSYNVKSSNTYIRIENIIFIAEE